MNDIDGEEIEEAVHEEGNAGAAGSNGSDDSNKWILSFFDIFRFDFRISNSENEPWFWNTAREKIQRFI